jgi:hypothetical protein
MPIRIAADAVSRPTSIPEVGGTVKIVFTAHAPTSGAAETKLQATYTISDESPYVFAAPTRPDRPKVVVGNVKSVPLGPREFSRSVRLTKVAGSPKAMFAFVDVSIQELGPDNHPPVLFGQPVAPITNPVAIDIQ